MLACSTLHSCRDYNRTSRASQLPIRNIRSEWDDFLSQLVLHGQKTIAARRIVPKCNVKIVGLTEEKLPENYSGNTCRHRIGMARLLIYFDKLYLSLCLRNVSCASDPAIGGVAKVLFVVPRLLWSIGWEFSLRRNSDQIAERICPDCEQTGFPVRALNMIDVSHQRTSLA